ncbi:MAG: hypothetical protein GYA36_19880 [Veillonellaceae bacterium]|nr:hypothetical protein [Veillonellaceae bacterium]
MTTPSPPDPILDLLQQPEYQGICLRIRQFMRDYAELNRLCDGYESSDRDILLAVVLTIDDINMTPPMITRTIKQMLDGGWAPLIVVGAVLWLLRSLYLHYTRNDIPFNDGGLMTNGLSAKAPAIQAWIDRVAPLYENQKKNAKIAANLAGMMAITPSGVPSEFSLVHGLGRTWQ